MPAEVATESQEGRGPVRRSGRQAKRTDKLEEFLLTTKRAGRRSGPASLEGGDPPSQTPTDAETASEASFDGSADVKSVDDKCESPEVRTRSGSRKKATGKAKGGRGKKAGGLVKDDASSDNDNEEGGGGDAPKKPQSKNLGQLRDQGDNQETEPEKTSPSEGHGDMEDQAEALKDQELGQKEIEVEAENKEKRAEEEKKQAPVSSGKRTSSRSPGTAPGKGSTSIKREAKSKPGPKSLKVQQEDDSEEEEDEDSSSSSSSSSSSDSDEDGGYDPNALYCICRQKHNKRFMICCDRCEEWFHGDCVGITEARGRLMERNGEDYVCPNCSSKKSHSAKAAGPATENGKPRASVGACKEEASSAASPAVAAPSASMTGTDEKGGEDMGIKGRIEKATNPSGKKKIKIFQPAALQPTAKAAADKPGPAGGKAAEDSALPKCIGPGCENNALPDSVYCGSDCILRHAAAAMKSITDVKEPKQKDKDKPKGLKEKPGTKSTPKKSAVAGKKTSKKPAEEEWDSKDEDSDEDQLAEEHPPPAATSSWSSDHNYNAVTPEKTTPISAVLNKACMYLFEGLDNPSLTMISFRTIGHCQAS